MPSFDDLAARCRHIGKELCEVDLSLYELLDRATALTLVARTLEELMEREYPVTASGMDVDPVQQDIDAAKAVLRDVALAAEVECRETLCGGLLTAQRYLLGACRLLLA